MVVEEEESGEEEEAEAEAEEEERSDISYRSCFTSSTSHGAELCT